MSYWTYKKTSFQTEPVLVTPEASLSDGKVAIATKIVKKLVMDNQKSGQIRQGF